MGGDLTGDNRYLQDGWDHVEEAEGRRLGHGLDSQEPSPVPSPMPRPSWTAEVLDAYEMPARSLVVECSQIIRTFTRVLV